MACTYTYKDSKLNLSQVKEAITNDLGVLVKSGAINLPGFNNLYQLDPNNTKKILTDLNQSVHENNSTTYLFNNKEIRRVTSIIKDRQKRKFGEAADKATKDIWDEAAATGDKLHKYNHDIVNKLTGGSEIVDTSKLNPNEKKVYDLLNAHITKLIKSKPDSIWLPESKIASEDLNIAGTVDLIEITKDNTINIYDYKTRSRKELHKIKLDEYSQQLKMYADILEKVTGLEVLQRRIIPIRIERSPSGIKPSIEAELPVALEKTGIEEYDVLLDKLYSRLDYLENQQVAEKNRLLHKDKIAAIQENIKNIQLTKDVTSTIEYAIKEVNLIISNLNNGIVNTDLKEYHDVLRLYTNFDRYVPEGQVPKDLGNLITIARQTERKLLKAEQDYLVTNGNKYGIIGTEKIQTTKDFLSPVRQASTLDRWIQGASFSEHPILQTLRRAVEGEVIRTRDEYLVIRDTVKAKQKALFDYLGKSTFEPFLQVDKEGKYTGKLVDKISIDYWREAFNAKQRGDLQWFVDNAEFDFDRYNKDLEGYKKFVSTFKDSSRAKVVLNKWIAENSTNRFKYNIPKRKWYDPKYVEITEGQYKGTPVEDFYNYYRTTMKELIKDLPLESVYDTFIPNLKADFLERTSNNGIGNALKSSFDMSFLESMRENPKYGKYDIDNNPIDNIPILYTDKLNPDEKSYDLGLLLALFSSTALNYKNLHNLESLKEASLSFMRNQDEYITTSKGEIKTSQAGQERKKPNPSSLSHYGQLKDYVDVVFYGRRHATEKTSTFKNKYLDKLIAWSKGEEVTEREYSWSKLFDSVLNFTAIKALGVNFFAPVTNYLSAEATSFMTGINGLYFSTANKAEALKMLAANDEKAKLLIDKFKVKMGEFELEELRSLSTSAIKMDIQDMAFVGFHVGDYVVQNSNFIAMLLSNKHEIKWSDYEVVDGKLVGNPKELDLIKFKNKVTKVNKKIMGNMDSNDYAAIKRYMLGRAVMQFRNWLPAMFKERWGREQYDFDLEEYTVGRYRTGFTYIINNVIKPMLGNTKEKFLAWNSLTKAQKAALRSNVLDLVIVMGVFGLVGMLKSDDDKTMMDRYTLRVMDRLLAELTFFSVLPLPNVVADKYQIIISPAASVSTIEDLIRVWDHTAKKISGEDGKPLRAIQRLTPGINQVVKLDEILRGEVQY